MLSKYTQKFLAKTPQYSRSYWTKLTTTGATIEECVQSSLDTLDQKKPDVCVVLASKSYTLAHYRKLTEELQSKLEPKCLIGGVVDRVAQVNHGISLLLGFEEEIVPFTINDSQDRLKIRNISVGRWGRVDDTERIKSQSEHIDKVGWKKFGSVSTPVQTYQLPPGLENKPSLVFTVSDNEPDQLLQALDHHYPDVPKVGIVGASTPFVTGEPYTLFNSDGNIMGSGIVGFASYTKADKYFNVQVTHTAMEKMGNPLKITRCRGNIILDLDDGGATGLLLRLIQSGPKLSKDEEFYLEIYPPGKDENSESDATVSRITSGDPGRGNMSIDTTADLQAGQVVQFMRKRNLEFKNVSSDPIEKDNIVFGVSEKDHTIDASPVQIPDEANVVPDVFGAVSENGVIVGRSDIPTEILDVPFSKVTINNF
ncbi:hypothetical protein [Parasitella parasitica]|uniref:FIST domain-containing protein n=1 Tax=Parasitella parasitica TaxID=35722 RepID=A0A0B7NIT3_9FUNG|nr:hypothetical protein [Parasitella parasitica]